MARSFGFQDERLTQSALEEQAARTRLLQEQAAAVGRELALKQAGLNLERELGQGKLDLGGKELTSKEKQAQLAGALEALGLGSKETIASQAERAALMSDVTKRPDITKELLARAMAEGGDPRLFNAIAQEKAQNREKQIQTMIPLLQKAKSDTEREKNIKPSLEALGPGTYAEALARAFPKSGQEVKPAAPETWPTTGTPAGQDRFSGLAERLLEAAGFGNGLSAGGRAAPEVARPLIQHGTIVGGPAGYDLNINTGEWVPTNTVGTINGRPATDVIAEGALKRGVSPEDTASRLVYNRLLQGAAPTQVATNVPAPTGITDLVRPPELPALPADQPNPNPNPTPAPTAAQLVQVANANAQPDAAAVEEARQRAIRQKMLEELLKQAAAQQQQQ